MNDYKSATISVTTEGTVISPDFDIENWSVYSVSAFTVEVSMGGSVYGDAIPGLAGIGLSMEIACRRIRIKSVSGTVSVNYVINGSE